MQRHLIIFAKAPLLGAVKTRLARDIGAAAALHFYERTARRTVETLARAGVSWQVWLAVTPDAFECGVRRRWHWLPR
ncbi:MAG: hypothetical protein ACREIP_21965, partial [Alphaproteobacteria bacterium]